jgi:hypothetical protein
MKYDDEMTNEQFETELPRYAADRMSAQERAEFTRMLAGSSERAHEAEELTNTARQFTKLLGSDRSEYALDPERFENLKSAAERVHPFPNRTRRFRIAAQIGVAAAALVVGAFLGSGQGHQKFRVERGLEQVPVSEQLQLQAVLDDPSFLYRYPPAYGLDRDEAWRMTDGKPWLDQVPTHPFAGSVLSHEKPHEKNTIPWYYGADGPTPYYPGDDLRWGYI